MRLFGAQWFLDPSLFGSIEKHKARPGNLAIGLGRIVKKRNS